MKAYDLNLARQKIQAFCVYQDRCHQDVLKKLKSWGLFSETVNLLLGELEDSNFLNEERFSRSFVRGKFRIKKWGRIKISNALQRRDINQDIIAKVLTEINEQDYFDTLIVLLKKKDAIEKEPNSIKRKVKLTRYLASKGFEFPLIEIAFKNIK